jgi:nucleotide-binding universal stress UspA family protein
VSERILVAVDGSEASARAVEVAARLARVADGDLSVVHVVEGRPNGEGEVEAGGPAQELVEEVVAKVGPEGTRATGRTRAVAIGRVAQGILSEAADLGASVIVVGSRGLSESSVLLVGSVTHRLLHLTDRPVIVVP